MDNYKSCPFSGFQYEDNAGRIVSLNKDETRWTIRVPRYPEGAPVNATWGEFAVSEGSMASGRALTWLHPIHANSLYRRVLALWENREDFWTCSENCIVAICRMVKVGICRPTDVLLLVQQADGCWFQIIIANDGEFIRPWPEDDKTLELDFQLRYHDGLYEDESRVLNAQHIARMRENCE